MRHRRGFLREVVGKLRRLSGEPLGRRVSIWVQPISAVAMPITFDWSFICDSTDYQLAREIRRRINEERRAWLKI